MAGLVEEDVGGLDVAVDDAVGVRRSEGAADLARDGQGLLEGERTVVEAPLERATTQPAHDQVGRVGVTPVVDERHDVGVLDAGHQVRFGLEAADEGRLRGQLAADLLDRHLAPDRGLHPAPHERRTSPIPISSSSS